MRAGPGTHFDSTGKHQYGLGQSACKDGGNRSAIKVAGANQIAPVRPVSRRDEGIRDGLRCLGAQQAALSDRHQPDRELPGKCLQRIGRQAAHGMQRAQLGHQWAVVVGIRL